MSSSNKNEEIKFRVTKQEKEQLKKLSASYKSMSAYILEKILSTDSDPQETIIDIVEICDLLNTIILEIEKSIDEPLKRRVKHIIDGRMQNGH